MNDRLMTLLGAIVAVLLVLVLFGGGQAPEPDLSRPTSVDDRRSGYAALARWAQGAGYEVTSLRRRYDWLLDAPDMPASGNLLVITLPLPEAVHSNERDALAQWIERGNSVLIFATYYGTPEWFHAAEIWAEAWSLDRVIDIGLDPVSIESDDEQEGATRFVPTGNHPLVAGIDSINLAAGVERWNSARDLSFHLPLLTLLRGEDGADEAALWLTTYGQGRIIVSGLPDLFSNAQLRERDNARLAANTLGYAVRGGHLVFDDMHHGLSALYDPDAFFADSRLHKTLLFLAVLWLAWLLGSTSRFYLGDNDASSRRPGPANFVRATGSFLAGTLAPATAAREMFRNFFADLRDSGRYRGDENAILERLVTDVRVDTALAQDLQRVYRHLQGDPAKIDLRRTHNLMLRIRNDIS
ncbi:MAG: DUF4350 domain-containing protein [Gammaproteobacteria bacterium]|nr:DUF4350 domain-containing protein [Gammaproteobacteria bacterium]